MKSITIGIRHDGKSDVIAGPDMPAHEQIEKLRGVQGSRTNPTYRRVEIYSLTNPDRFTSFDAETPTEIQEKKGKK